MIVNITTISLLKCVSEVVMLMRSGGGDSERRDEQQVQLARGGAVCETVSLPAATGLPARHHHHPHRLLRTAVHF